MFSCKSTLALVGLAITLISANHALAAAEAEVSHEAMSLPFPPDTRDLEFVAWAGDITFESPSPLKALAAFYLKEMADRGWQLDPEEVEIDDDSIDLTFKHADAEVEMRFSQWSKAVKIRMDCTKLQFTDTDNPAKLAKAGIPVPPAAVFMQSELTLPDGAQDLKYDGDGCMLKSPLAITPAFEHFAKQIKAKGFRESRRPIITDSRHYNEYKKGSAEFSINVFEDKVGSRIVLEYEDPRNQRRIAPLAQVASLPIKNPVDEEAMAAEAAEAAVEKTPINVANNRGEAIVDYGGKKYVFKHVACYRTKDRGDYATEVIFASEALPLNKMQKLIASQDDFTLGDMYEFDFPDYFMLQLGEFQSLSFSASGIGIGGYSTETGTNEMKMEGGRVTGTFKMPPKEILNRPFSFTATIDAAIITPTTRFSSGIADPVEKSNNPLLSDSPIPMPEGAEDVSREGSNFRKTYHAVVNKPQTEVAQFYSQQMVAQGWQPVGAGESLLFKNDTQDATVTLARKGNETTIEAVVRETASARREGVLPEPGKGRLVLANAHTSRVVFTIGKTDYPLNAGRGAESLKQALNYSIKPGTYKVVIKVPGEAPQTEMIELTEGSAWGVIAVPTGGYMALQLY